MANIKFPFIALIVFLLAGSAFAQFEYGGAGGLFISGYTPDLGFLNDKLKQVTPGFDDIEGTVLTWGGGGYGEISENFRLGGWGFGGGRTISGTFPDPADVNVRINQDVIFGIGGGGLYGEWVAGHILKRWEGTVSLGLGGYGTAIRIAQFGANVTWDDMLGSLTPGAERNTFAIEFSSGGLLMVPGIGIKFYATNFLAIEAHLDYLVMFPLGDWTFSEVKVRGMPDVNLNAPSFGVRFMFGG